MFILEDSVIKGLREATKDQEYFIVWRCLGGFYSVCWMEQF